MSAHLDPKQTLRSQLRQNRRSLSVDEQLIAAKNLLDCFKKYFFNNNGSEKYSIKNIALYLSNDGEISPHLLCDYFWQKNIKTYLPIIQDQQLAFALYSEQTMWQKNIYGIKEPMTENYFPKEALDIVFLPLVGFDVNGSRLGMGGGFYDKTFEGKKADKAPLLIGLAHDCQQVKLLPIEDWDVPLKTIITPTKIIKV